MRHPSMAAPSGVEILGRARDRVPDDLPVTALLLDQPIRPAVIRQVAQGHQDLVVMIVNGQDKREAPQTASSRKRTPAQGPDISKARDWGGGCAESPAR